MRFVASGTRESSYQKVARELRGQILQGLYANGRQLPTEFALATSYGVSRQTVRRAFQDLLADGLVTRIPGRGTFAKMKSDTYIRQFGSVEDLMALSTDTQLTVTSLLNRKIDIIAAGRLGLDSDVVYQVSFIRSHDQTPFCVSTVSLPPEVGQMLSSEKLLTTTGSQSNATIIGLIDKQLKDPIAEAQQSITVGRASESVAGHLGCEVGTSLLRIDRLYLDTRNKPVELATSYFDSELYSYRISLRRDIS